LESFHWRTDALDAVVAWLEENWLVDSGGAG
jgi:hypothetical protein